MSEQKVLASTSDQTIDTHAKELVFLSHSLHEDPEVAFQETRSVNKVAGVLSENGFEVELGYLEIPTAFRATYGEGRDTVTICCEYDALPGLGHACGHNIIAAAGVGAALGLASVSDLLDARIEVLGTPAEERGAGKTILLARGAWDESLLSIMVHPGPQKYWDPLQDCSMIGKDRFKVVFHGKSSHAAAGPEEAINAADAATLAQVAIGLVRQQLPDGVRVSSFVSSGGEVTNIIPALTVLEVEARAHSLEQLEDVKAKLMRCFEGAAVATGCELEVEDSEPRCEPVLQDPHLAKLWNQAMQNLGVLVSRETQPIGGSTDMGNVSQRVASLHPIVGVEGVSAPIHTRQFAAAAATCHADETIIVSSKAMARTVISALTDTSVRDELIELKARRRLPSSV